ncbi:MAG: RNA polymerase sigma factor [Solirubrobacteraceae bacterium]
MASIDGLPADQRAVLQLVLQRGRTYDDIAQLLSIDRAAVRERALSALDALGPGTRVPAEQRALITDYLLGQLPGGVADNVHDRLAESASERAWARVVASELGTLARGPLPEIPVEGASDGDAGAVAAEAIEEPVAADAAPEQPAAAAAGEPATVAAAEPAAEGASAGPRPAPAGPGDDRPSSRRGGAILLGAGALGIIVVVVIVILLVSGGSSKKHTTTTAASASTTAPASSTAATSTGTSSTATGTPTPVAQVNLTSPSGNTKTKGAAVIVRQGSTTAIEILAQGVPANTAHDAYAVWLYNSASDSKLLGFVNPGIKANGVLRTLGPLPANSSHFKHLLVTRETQAKPHGPGATVLQGTLNLPAGT